MVRPKTGKQYRYPILLDKECYDLILKEKQIHEPIGSAAKRLIELGLGKLDIYLE